MPRHTAKREHCSCFFPAGVRLSKYTSRAVLSLGLWEIRMTKHHVVVGAGPVGVAVAQALAARGDTVTLATRSGRGPHTFGIALAAVDAADTDSLASVASGAATIFNCANPGDYTQWEERWPPIAEGLLEAAERTGATLAITGNLYPYGSVSGSMTEGMPDAATDHKGQLRAKMWADVLAAHQAGRVSAVEVRGSDFVGPGVGSNGHLTRQIPSLKGGKVCRVVGSPDQPHTWTYVPDLVAALIAASDDETAHGQIWHAPSNPPLTQRAALRDLARVAGWPEPRVKALPGVALRLGAALSPMIREIRELEYQWVAPYVLDDTASRSKLHLEPTPWDGVLAATAPAFTDR